MNNILVKIQRNPLGNFTRETFIKALKNKLQGRAEEAWIFGSLARGKLTRHSDIDLIVVAQTSKPFVERAREYDDLFDLVPALDLLVYTPEEFFRLTENPTAGFWSQLTTEMIRVFP